MTGRHIEHWQRFMKYAVEMSSGTIIIHIKSSSLQAFEALRVVRD
jgi:uridine phosphorylase